MKINYKKQLYSIYRKKSFQDIPRLLIVLLSMAVLSALFYALIIAVFGENVSKINIAYVTDYEDSSLQSELKYITRNVNCDFKQYTKERARKALDEKKVAAVLEISEDKSMSFSYYDNDEYLTFLFGDIIKAGMTDYLVVNTTTKAVKEVDPDFDKEQLKTIKDELTDYLIYRNSNYDRIVFSDTGDVPLKYFYAGTGVAFLVLLSAAVLIGFMKKDDELFISFAKKTGIGNVDIFFARYVPIAVIYSVVTLAAILMFQFAYLGRIMLLALLASILATLVLLLTVIFIHEVISNRLVSTLTAILVSILTMFLSGSIIPLSYLPAGVSWFSDFIPTKASTKIYGQVFFGRFKNSAGINALVFAFVILVITLLFIFIKGRSEKHEAA